MCLGGSCIPPPPPEEPRPGAAPGNTSRTGQPWGAGAQPWADDSTCPAGLPRDTQDPHFRSMSRERRDPHTHSPPPGTGRPALGRVPQHLSLCITTLQASQLSQVSAQTPPPASGHLHRATFSLIRSPYPAPPAPSRNGQFRGGGPTPSPEDWSSQGWASLTQTQERTAGWGGVDVGSGPAPPPPKVTPLGRGARAGPGKETAAGRAVRRQRLLGSEA